MRNRYLYPAIILVCTTVILTVPGQIQAWVGLELDGKATGVSDPYGAVGGQKGSGTLWELSGRAMYQDSFGPVDTELHWLVRSARSTGDYSFTLAPEHSPFRFFDLEATYSDRSDRSLTSEIDRLSMTFNGPRLAFTLGRQAVTWGEAFYFNIGDIFGAFPVTETNRRYKPGIDAAAATLELGTFSSLSLMVVPVRDESDSIAAHLLLPLGPGTISLTGGRVLKNNKIGSGYSVDIAGTQVYGSLLLTRTEGGDSYSQAVAGLQRQVGPNTLLMGEIYRNGYGTSNPDDYPSLILSEEYRSGSIFTLGKYCAALHLSQQVSPLITLTPTVFANLSDGSALLELNGVLSQSDLTDISAGIFAGFGKRPEDGVWQSEYGSAPASIYIEIVHNIGN